MIFAQGTEVTTSITNLLTAAACMACIDVLKKRDGKNKKTQLWMVAISFFMVVSLIGSLSHGIVWEQNTGSLILRVLNLLITLMLGSYVAAVECEVKGEAAMKRAVCLFLGVAVAFGIIWNLLAHWFNVDFILFNCFCVANLAYVIRILVPEWKRQSRKWFLLGVFLLIAGSVCQSLHGLRLTLIWTLDCNGIYHLFTLLFLLCEMAGILRARQEEALKGQG